MWAIALLISFFLTLAFYKPKCALDNTREVFDRGIPFPVTFDENHFGAYFCKESCKDLMSLPLHAPLNVG
jgi:hypothetical protein